MFKEGQHPQPEPTPEEMRKRVDSLRENDNKYTDSVRILAENEDEFRKELKDAGINGKVQDKIADKFSTKDLEKIEAEKKKWIDDLTGLPNKNYFLAEAPRLLGLEKRENNHCTMMVIDFDHFKDVNDTYGHAAGDQALKEITKRLKASLRGTDEIARYGGEEFTVLLPDTISSDGTHIAEKLKTVIESSPIPIKIMVVGEDGKEHEAEIKLNKTISIGLVGTDQLREDWNKFTPKNSEKFLEKMFDAADVSTLASKGKGRNQVTLYSETDEIIKSIKAKRKKKRTK